MLNSTKFIIWSESKKFQNSELIFNNFLVATLSTKLNKIWGVTKLVKTIYNGMNKMLMYMYKRGWICTSQKLGRRGDAEIRLFSAYDLYSKLLHIFNIFISFEKL